jgi:branched-chain amino acid aminotransferase
MFAAIPTAPCCYLIIPMSLLWLNGTLIEKNEARISPFDHGFLYGDGVWEPLRVFNGLLFHAADHARCLFQSAEKLHLEIPMSQTEVIEAIETTVKANKRVDGYIRVIVTRGPGTLGPDPRKISPQVIVIAEEYHPFPLELYDHGLHASVFKTRIERSSTLLAARTLGEPSIPLAKHDALQNGCLEAILVNHATELLGTTEGVLFLVKQSAVSFDTCQRLDWIGCRIASLAREMGITVTPDPLRLQELLNADEVFQAGASCGVIGIVRVDGKPIGGGTEGPITRTIREAYARLTRGGGADVTSPSPASPRA